MRRALVALAMLVAVGVAAPARAGDGVALLKYMPDDVNTYVAVDVSAVKGAPLFTAAVTGILGIMPPKDADQAIKVFGPATVSTVALGAPLPEKGAFVGVIETDDADAMLQRTAKVDSKQVATKYRGITYLSDKKAAIAAVDRHHLVLARPDRIEAAIDVALGKRSSAAKSAVASKLRDAVAATDTRHDVWMVMIPWDAVTAPLHEQGMDLTSVSIAAGVSDSLVLDGTIVCADAASAKKLFERSLDKDAGMIVPTLQKVGLAGAAKTYEASRDGAVIHASSTLAQDDLALLVARAMHR